MEDIVFIFPIPRIQIYDVYTYTQGPFLTFQIVTKAKLQSYLLKGGSYTLNWRDEIFFLHMPDI